jgi:glycine cleavage system H protein
MSEIRYTADHEWVRIEGDAAVVGLTNYAQEQLGELVFVELPDIGRELSKGDEAAVVESVKAASEIHSPVSGTVTEVNETLTDQPTKVNEDPLGDGWFFKLKLSNPGELDELMDEAAYKAILD